MFGLLVTASLFFITSASERTMGLYKLRIKMKRLDRFVGMHRLPLFMQVKLRVRWASAGGLNWGRRVKPAPFRRRPFHSPRVDAKRRLRVNFLCGLLRDSG